MSIILYQERFASGSSLDHNKIGLGASNCLTIIVTSEALRITSFFPFTLFMGFYDLEHDIPTDAIRDVREGGMAWGQHRLIVQFRRESGRISELELRPRDYGKLKQAVETIRLERST